MRISDVQPKRLGNLVIPHQKQAKPNTSQSVFTVHLTESHRRGSVLSHFAYAMDGLNRGEELTEIPKAILIHCCNTQSHGFGAY